MKKYIQDSPNNKFLKLTICDESKSIFNSIIRKLREISNIDVLDVGHMSRKTIKQGTEDISIEYYYTEISLKDVDKWNAIEYLINKIGIENAGLGIAMGQSTPIVRQMADYITENNDEDGVKKALEKYC